MASPSPLPPESSERASSSRMNASKMRSRSSAAIGGPSLDTVNTTASIVVRIATPMCAAAWRSALSSRLRTTHHRVRIGSDRRRLQRGRVLHASGRTAQSEFGVHHLVEVHRNRGVDLHRPGPRKHAQIACQLFQPRHLQQRILRHLGPVGPIRIRERHFQLGANRGQRTAQLVRGTRPRTAAAGAPRPPVGRACGSALRRAWRSRRPTTGVHSPGQIRCLDAVDLGPHRVDRRQGSGHHSRDQPRRQCHLQRHQDRAATRCGDSARAARRRANDVTA